MKKNKIRFDLIALLPVELSGSIFALLPEIEKPKCFNVSTTWRERMIATGSTIWKNIFNNKGNNKVDKVSVQNTAVLLQMHYLLLPIKYII